MKIQQAPVSAEEDRILRLWTPILLRSIVIISMTVLIAGLVLTATIAPNYFVNRYHQIQLGHLLGREHLATIWSNLVAGQPHAVLTVGLYLLTLVPLARVAFCLVLFIKTRDIAYIGFTAYVFAALIIGFLLGHVG
ncbi:MAG: DUF1634 domain-containing protein [Deltaproteobacteria bacterium]|nr:DUF1634 domain-containing protein [Deltaproteobacteria bacterium]